VGGDGAIDAGRLGGVAERAAQGPHRLAQGAVGNDHVAPHRVEDLPPMHRLGPPLQEEDEEIEIAGD
jgi:hypothetical protein